MAEATGLPSIADDSGLVVRTLHGAQESARYAGRTHRMPTTTNDFEALGEQSDRRAFFRCMVFCVGRDPMPLIATAQWHGEILQTPRGDGGFSYDPLFWLPEHKQSAAQLPKAIKNGISHRGRACAKLEALDVQANN